MPRRPEQPRRVRVAAAVIAVVIVLFGTVAVTAANNGSVTSWARRTAIPLATVDPAAPLGDLADLRTSIGDAEIVGLGESVHGASELLTLKHRTVRFVEGMGFRSVAWEEDWTTGLEIDRYVRTGRGDLDAIVDEMSPQWPWHEVVDVLRWLREYNATHRDQVRFFGVEYYVTGRLAYDAIEAYAAEVAPARLDELRDHFRLLRPFTDDKFAHAQWYAEAPHKARYIRHAHAVRDLVREVARRDGGRRGRIALHHARQIVSFYEHYRLSFDDANVYRDAHAARNLRWWQRFTGDKVVYWAASPHVANAPRLRIVQPGGPDLRFPSAGSYLQSWYGERYRPIGYVFDHGTVNLEPGATAVMPPPRPAWFEHPLGEVGLDQLALDLRRHAPPPVREWLRGPIITRGLADSGPDGYMTGGSLGQWFDVVIHRQVVSPSVAA